MIDDNKPWAGQRRAARSDAARASLQAPDTGADAGPPWRRLLELMADAVVTTDGSLRISSWPDAAAATYGWPAALALGQHIDALLRTELLTMTQAEATSRLTAQGFVVVEALHHTRAGERRRTRTHLIGLPDGRGALAGTLRAILDVTGQRDAEEALAELNHTLEERVAARTAEVGEQALQLRALATELARVEQRERQRLATILHEQVQQLIVAAQMQTGVIARDAGSERLRQAARAAQEALHGALVTSRSLTLELCPPVLKDAGLIDALAWLAERVHSQHGCRLSLHAEPDAEPADEELRYLLFECASELLRNVAMHAGVDRAELALRRPSAGSLVLSVADQGRGFDPLVVSRRRADQPGFGLFSIRERVAHLGGRMDLDSAPGRGTRVTLTLPETMAQVKATAVATTRQVAWARGADLRPRLDTLRVLIVDDHQIMRQGLAGLFQFEPDLEVVGEADSGEQALALAAELGPDVVIMDVNLGAGIDGVETTRRLLTAQPQLRVIGLSMHMDGAVAKAMRDAGAAAYLT
jgi:PAS domain S-box-containing protein